MEKSKSGLSTRWKLLVQMEQSWPLFSLTFLVLAPSVEAKLTIVFTDFLLLLKGLPKKKHKTQVQRKPWAKAFH